MHSAISTRLFIMQNIRFFTLKYHCFHINYQVIQKTKQSERKKRNIMVVRNLIHNLNTTFSNAVELLGLPQQEIDEIKKYFQS